MKLLLRTALISLTAVGLIGLSPSLQAVERTYGPYVSKKKKPTLAEQKAAAEARAQAEKEASLGYQLSKAHPLPDRITTTVNGPRIVDHRSVDGFTGPDAAAKAKIDGWGVALAHCPGDTDFYTGLSSLAGKDSAAYSYKESRRPTSGFFKKGGFGRMLVGQKKEPTSRIEGFASKMDRFGDDVDVALLGMQAPDLSPGKLVQYTTKVYRVRLDIRSYKVSLNSVFTENIQAISNQNGVAVASNFPLELPNMEVAGLSTSVIVPAGAGLTTRRSLSPRYPGVAFAFYRDSMEATEKAFPQTQLVWSTVPLEKDDNLQRNLYNTLVREYALKNKKPLYDIAALQAHDPAGHLVEDEQGPKLAEAWQGGKYAYTMNAEGQERLAQGWWAMLTELAR